MHKNCFIKNDRTVIIENYFKILLFSIDVFCRSKDVSAIFIKIDTSG